MVGKRARAHPAYEVYSDAIGASGIIWDRERLAGFLEFPLGYLRGTTMGFAGIADDRERSDVIAYLERENERALCIWERLTAPRCAPRRHRGSSAAGGPSPDSSKAGSAASPCRGRAAGTRPKSSARHGRGHAATDHL